MSSTDLDINRQVRYCALAIYAFGATTPTLLASKEKIVLFETKRMAQNVVPQLGGGRLTRFSEDGEYVHWVPFDIRGCNRAVLVTNYDPYHTPANHPVRSETRGKAWREHILWNEVWTDVGQMRRRADGTYANLALGEDPAYPEDPRFAQQRGPAPREETHDEAMSSHQETEF